MSTLVERTRPERPSRAEIEPAALDLIRSHGAQILATARHYAASPEDAEDAYQRGLEILLTKAPSTSAEDLVPWLKTVVKHEAFALRRQRARHGEPTEHDDATPAHGDTHEHVERLEQLQHGAEALGRLKPQEIRCMLLLAEGHSYAEICAITGYSYTKVNRCLAEGRQSFMRRLDGIESGAECERLAPLISAAADRELGADDMLALRRHLRTCLACRAALRDARSVPARVAAVAPAGLLLSPHQHGGAGLQGAWSWLHDRFTALVLRGQDAMEMAAAHKAAAVAASAVALAGGGAAAVQTVAHHSGPKPAPAVSVTPARKVVAASRAARPRIATRRHIGTLAAKAAPRRHKPAPAPTPPAAAPQHPRPQPQAPAPPARSPLPAAHRPAEPQGPAPSAPGSGTGEFGP